MMGGQSTHMPLRVNSGGVMPVIFASSILSIPADAGLLSGIQSGNADRYFGQLMDAMKWGEPLYTVALLPRHHFLRVLLRFDRLQSE